MIRTSYGSGSWTIVLSALLAIASVGSFAGCDTGSRSNSAATGTGSGGGTGGGGTGGGSTGQLTFGTVAIGSTATGQIIGPNGGGSVLAQIFTLAASGTQTVSVTSIKWTASGTINETRFSRAVVVQDANSNGVVDTAEAASSLGATNPAFSQDNGTTTVTFTTPLSLTAGTSNQYFLLFDSSGISTVTSADAGATVVTQVAAAADVVATAGGSATTAGGTFAGTQTVTLGIHDHLLLSEVAWTPTAGEFIEIFNPTPYAVPMTNYHITDVSQQQFKYWELPNGTGFAPLSTSTNSDWHMRFPSGFTINPGQVIVVAMDGAGFAGTTFTPAVPSGTPVLAMRNVATGQTAMLVFRGNSAFDFVAANNQGTTPVSYSSGSLTNGSGSNGEGIALFFWDGQANPVSALVTDIDYVFYGTPTTANARTNKTGESVNKTTTPTATGTFKSETPGANASAAGTGDSVARTNFVETGETGTNSNGFNGDDEMSEPGTNWTQGSTTPGTVP